MESRSSIGSPSSTWSWTSVPSPIVSIDSESDRLNSSSTWDDFVDHLYSHCNLRRKLVLADTLSIDYAWGGDVQGYEEWQQSEIVCQLLQFVKNCTACINADEKAIFFTSRPSLTQRHMQKRLACSIVDYTTGFNFNKIVHEFKTSMGKCHPLGERYRRIGNRMATAVGCWLEYLAHILEKNPVTTPERIYEELFRKFLDIFDLINVNGDSELFTMPCGEHDRMDDIVSRPDLLFGWRKGNSVYWRAVQVKHMEVDPAFRHFFLQPKKGILKLPEDIPSTENNTSTAGAGPVVPEHSSPPAKRKCVSYHSEAAEKDDNPECEASFPTYIKSLLDTFFSQLCGSVIALDCHQPSVAGKRLAIGVVGFRIIFLTFYAKPEGKFSKILETRGSKMEVHLTRPLCILSSKDREEIVKILLQVAAFEPM